MHKNKKKTSKIITCHFSLHKPALSVTHRHFIQCHQLAGRRTTFTQREFAPFPPFPHAMQTNTVFYTQTAVALLGFDFFLNVLFFNENMELAFCEMSGMELLHCLTAIGVVLIAVYSLQWRFLIYFIADPVAKDTSDFVT